MTRSLYVTLVVIWLGFALAASSRAEEPAAVEWVPFVATWVEQDEFQKLQVPFTLHLSGIYVRDKRGSWFRRATASPIRGGLLAITVYADTAILCDRVNHTFYSLNFMRKTIKPLQVDATSEPLFGDNPISPQAFEQHHSQDKFLGKRTISGVEGEGCGIGWKAGGFPQVGAAEPLWAPA